MKYKIITLMLLFCSIATINAQNTIDLSLLNGEWAGKEITNTADDYKEVIGAAIDRSEASHILHFLTTTTLSFKEGGTQATHSYTVANDAITFSTKVYTVLALNNTTLKLQEVGNASNTILYFNKIESGGY